MEIRVVVAHQKLAVDFKNSHILRAYVSEFQCYYGELLEQCIRLMSICARSDALVNAILEH